MPNYNNNQTEQNSPTKETIMWEINQKLKALERKNEIISLDMYEADLIRNDIVSVVRDNMAANHEINVFAGLDSAEELNNTWLELSSANKNVYANFAKDVQKKCKASAAKVTDIVKSSVLNSDPDFSELLDVSKNEAGTLYLFQYTYRGILPVCVGFPVFSEANAYNFNDVLAGYLVGVKGDPQADSFAIIARDLNYKTIIPAFKEWYENNQQATQPPETDKKPS